MIKLQKISVSQPKNLVYHEFYPNQRFGFACLSYYPAECAEIAQVNAEILDNILKLQLENWEEEKLEEQLIEFFMQLNWRIYSIFQQIGCQEKGISLVLVINIDDELIIVPFGRFICGIWDENGMQELGLAWENFTVKSMQELKLLGNLAQDLKPNMIKHQLVKGSGISILPAHKNIYAKIDNWNQMINQLQDDSEDFPHLILSNGIISKPAKRKLWKR
ncbi:MAG: hypothetical protein R6U84_05830 [Candidatus Cloacimonadales bacterium]